MSVSDPSVPLIACVDPEVLPTGSRMIYLLQQGKRVRATGDAGHYDAHCVLCPGDGSGDGLGQLPEIRGFCVPQSMVVPAFRALIELAQHLNITQVRIRRHRGAHANQDRVLRIPSPRTTENPRNPQHQKADKP